jgi:type IV secretion system protein VirB7
MKKFFLLFGIACIAGCSTAGPFVSSISSDGNNGLIVEKCDIEFNGFLGIISNYNCRTTNVTLRQ